MRFLVVVLVVVVLVGCAPEPTELVQVELSALGQEYLSATVSMMAPGDTLWALGDDGEYYPIAFKRSPRLPDGVLRVTGAWVVGNAAGDSFFVYFEEWDELWQVAPPWCDVVVDSLYVSTNPGVWSMAE